LELGKRGSATFWQVGGEPRIISTRVFHRYSGAEIADGVLAGRRSPGAYRKAAMMLSDDLTAAEINVSPRLFGGALVHLSGQIYLG
jgi:hypothetical protein